MKRTIKREYLKKEFIRMVKQKFLMFSLLAHRMAEIALEREDYRKKHGEATYRRELRKRKKRYEGYLSKYKDGKVEPKRKVFLLMVKAMECTEERLASVVYLNDSDCSEDDETSIISIEISKLLERYKKLSSNQSQSRARLRAVINWSSKVNHCSA